LKIKREKDRMNERMTNNNSQAALHKLVVVDNAPGEWCGGLARGALFIEGAANPKHSAVTSLTVFL
jgi:hypothetical protein